MRATLTGSTLGAKPFASVRRLDAPSVADEWRRDAKSVSSYN
jgi:hypothetical protein